MVESVRIEEKKQEAWKEKRKRGFLKSEKGETSAHVSFWSFRFLFIRSEGFILSHFIHTCVTHVFIFSSDADVPPLVFPPLVFPPLVFPPLVSPHSLKENQRIMKSFWFCVCRQYFSFFPRMNVGSRYRCNLSIYFCSVKQQRAQQVRSQGSVQL